ncbi:hypothetical protein A2765_01425 [Candidatus Kaiserbacteria bacterium RIFCSPHIGHO2_01_FULL_56_24]|uniref:Uncharacterized protein n=1 Tax=Candidatus Kaiserbacteria bacterium RIFCSPHIGHO2_01_FULL_56_24 TaxID=1798487 RepID=A0A1F6DHG7_9BACT|nr:MAG: hypothetical protein A2765_01425 [Candidatus Kaiserbacteria bacterium RIFCSPHIGHO2_01_FULL_56_24]
MTTTKEPLLHDGESYTFETPVLLGEKLFTQVRCISRLRRSANEFIVMGTPEGSDAAAKFLLTYDTEKMEYSAIDLVHDGAGLRIVA